MRSYISYDELEELGETIVRAYINKTRRYNALCVDIEGLVTDYLGLTVVYETIAEDDPKDNWDDLWCKCDFSFRSDNWLNYKSVSNEVLLSCEIDELERSLTQLLDGEITEKNMKPARTIKFERHNRITQGHKVSIQYIYSLTL